MQTEVVLAIDNSLEFLNIAIADESGLIEERHVRPPKPSSQILPGQVKNILASHERDIEHISLIVVTLGPGSFTGIRVALAFSKGLAAGGNIPIVGVPTLDALTVPFSFLEGRYLCPLIDAKKGEVFTALYFVSHGSIERLTDYTAMKPTHVPAMVRTPCVCFGSGTKLLGDTLSSLESVLVIREGFSMISGEAVIQRGLRLKFDKQERNLNPLYCRRSEAEIKFGINLT